MAKLSAVHTPRNVELPMHVTSSKVSKNSGSTRKCLWMTCWLLGLVLLCSAVVVIAQFLLPSAGKVDESPSGIGNHPDDTLAQISDTACLDRFQDIYSLEQKFHSAEIILTGHLGGNTLRVEEVLKATTGVTVGDEIHLDPEIDPCYIDEDVRQMFFLSDDAYQDSRFYRPMFKSIVSSPKLISICKRILSKLTVGSSDIGVTEAKPHLENLGKSIPDVCFSEGLECLFGSTCDASSPGFPRCACTDVCKDLPEVNGVSPVCGSDHVTYKNFCAVKEAACGKQENIVVVANASCSEANLCGSCLPFETCQLDPLIGQYRCMCKSCFYFQEKNVVCGDDGKDYKNICELNLEACSKKTSISVAHEGPCGVCNTIKCPVGLTCVSGKCVCPLACPNEYQPVCGTDGKTYYNECWMLCASSSGSSVPENVKVYHRGQCDLPKPTCSVKSRLNGEPCACPRGHEEPRCEKCLANFWAFTSFGCTECNCSRFGSVSSDCDPDTGLCKCKTGFTGDKCQTCPDGSISTPSGCITNNSQLQCGRKTCSFGAICSIQNGFADCVCESDCNEEKFGHGPVCGSDGNTYRSECQLLQNSCRIQREIVIAGHGPCKDAPPLIYGLEKTTRQADILSDGAASSAVIGLLGDLCLEDRDCYIENSMCLDNICGCLHGFRPTPGNISCESEEQSFCNPNPCHGGGTCDEHDGTFTCYCPEGLTGPRCQHDITKTNISVASFIGNSFIGVITPEEAVSRLEIEMVFRTFSQNGILIYADGSGSSGFENDFISLTIIDGFIEFRYDLGSGAPLVLRSPERVVLGNWHQVVAKRYHQDGLLLVDGGERVTGQSRGSLKTLNIGQLSWIGGVDNDLKDAALKRTGTSSGLNGCIKDLLLSRNVVSIQSDLEPLIMQRKQVIECSEHPCSSLPCENDGSCSADDQGYICQCKSNFSGRRCQKPRNQCHPNPCKNQARCQLTDEGFQCNCKSGFSGKLCEISLQMQKDSSTPRRHRKKMEMEKFN